MENEAQQFSISCSSRSRNNKGFMKLMMKMEDFLHYAYNINELGNWNEVKVNYSLGDGVVVNQGYVDNDWGNYGNDPRGFVDANYQEELSVEKGPMSDYDEDGGASDYKWKRYSM